MSEALLPDGQPAHPHPHAHRRETLQVRRLQQVVGHQAESQDSLADPHRGEAARLRHERRALLADLHLESAQAQSRAHRRVRLEQRLFGRRAANHEDYQQLLATVARLIATNGNRQ